MVAGTIPPSLASANQLLPIGAQRATASGRHGRALRQQIAGHCRLRIAGAPEFLEIPPPATICRYSNRHLR